MVFSSHIFIYYFLPIALTIYYALPIGRRHLALALLSYVFYGWANPAFVLLLVASTGIDYACGLVIAGDWASWRSAATPEPLPVGGARNRRQRLALAVSLVSNLSLLGFFKYFNFGVESLDSLLRASGGEGLPEGAFMRVVLPLGISFYTFQSMSYSIDVYRGHARALRSAVDFACYVAMYPQLVAGPIVRFAELADQLLERRHTLEKFARGSAFFCLGMAKKVLLANPCGELADATFGAGALQAADAWYGLLGYAFQIYFDFSGYSDMAIGLGLMLGFAFPKNFDSPYQADSLTDFWRRWHISLSSWLRDYLYLPLGGNRKGRWRTYLNLAVVMLLGGLWHGAAWTFVAWGALHGGLLALERARSGASLWASWPRPLRVLTTFGVLLLTWVFFRASSLQHALGYLSALVPGGDPIASSALVAGELYDPNHLLRMALAAVVVWWAPQTWDWTRRLSAGRGALCVLLFWAALLELDAQAFNPFIYFIF